MSGFGHPELITDLLTATTNLLRELRLLGAAVAGHFGRWAPTVACETLWLDVVLDLTDAQGERAVITRRQRVRVLAPGGVVVRELVWGEGEQCARYTVRGAQRL